MNRLSDMKYQALFIFYEKWQKLKMLSTANSRLVLYGVTLYLYAAWEMHNQLQIFAQ